MSESRRWRDERESVLGRLEALESETRSHEERISNLELVVDVPPGPAPPVDPPLPPDPEPPVAIISVEDQQAIRELYDKWQRVAVRFETQGVTMDWRAPDNSARHYAKTDPDRFKDTVAEAVEHWVANAPDKTPR